MSVGEECFHVGKSKQTQHLVVSSKNVYYIEDEVYAAVQDMEKEKYEF